MRYSRSRLLLVGEFSVLLSAVHAGWKVGRERRLQFPSTMANFEEKHQSANSNQR